jgi:hypothetical protein
MFRNTIILLFLLLSAFILAISRACPAGCGAGLSIPSPLRLWRIAGFPFQSLTHRAFYGYRSIAIAIGLLFMQPSCSICTIVGCTSSALLFYSYKIQQRINKQCAKKLKIYFGKTQLPPESTRYNNRSGGYLPGIAGHKFVATIVSAQGGAAAGTAVCGNNIVG